MGFGGPGGVGGAPLEGNGSVVEQLRCSWACGLGGSLVGAGSPSPHLRSAAVTCLLPNGPWPGLGCCFSWPSGVQPCPQVSPCLLLSLCPTCLPEPPSPSGRPGVGEVQGGRTEALGPLGGSHQKPIFPSPLHSTSQLPCSGAPRPAPLGSTVLVGSSHLLGV